ncbi:PLASMODESMATA CALLOSE-BINDING protein 3 [Dorcoceras hygrometricum]|uniref:PLASMODESMATA CALLOSE-BINDING protein 3 n=1 Tax=Dorcoceras hygrometricum TaxID=472368 RepID=A0A2Z7CCF6_9LAMI|nr:PLASMODESMATA CALLOSE-BINDING protein 3 [Dorcoceras hygrometricum]
MAVFIVIYAVILFAMAIHSDANYCVCNSGLSDTVLQKNIDYACGSGADCSGILQNGACFNPNTVKDHCTYAVNSYYQRKGQTAGSCVFDGTATVTANAPNAVTGCVYPSSPRFGVLFSFYNSFGVKMFFYSKKCCLMGFDRCYLHSTGGSSVGGTPNSINGTNSGAFPGSTVPTGGSSFDSSARMTLLARSTITSMLLPFFFSTFFLYGLM